MSVPSICSHIIVIYLHRLLQVPPWYVGVKSQQEV